MAGVSVIAVFVIMRAMVSVSAAGCSVISVPASVIISAVIFAMPAVVPGA